MFYHPLMLTRPLIRPLMQMSRLPFVSLYLYLDDHRKHCVVLYSAFARDVNKAKFQR